MDAGGFSTYLSQAVTWVLVILGWTLVNRQNNSREERKEIREFISDISKRVAELRDASFKYHTATQKDDTLSADIRFKFIMLGARFTTLRRYGILDNTDLVKQLRRAATLENFDTLHFQSQPANSNIIAEIETATEAITEGLERAFFENFLKGGCKSFRLCRERWCGKH